MYNLQEIIRRLDDWMNEDKILYSFKICNQQIQVYDKATNKILAYVNNKLNYKMIEEYSAYKERMRLTEADHKNNTNENEFILLQYTNSLLIRILSTC